MKLEVVLTINFECPPPGLEVEDLGKWSRGFRDSIEEFTSELQQFIQKQPIVEGCKSVVKDSTQKE